MIRFPYTKVSYTYLTSTKNVPTQNYSHIGSVINFRCAIIIPQTVCTAYVYDRPASIVRVSQINGWSKPKPRLHEDISLQLIAEILSAPICCKQFIESFGHTGYSQTTRRLPLDSILQLRYDLDTIALLWFSLLCSLKRCKNKTTELPQIRDKPRSPNGISIPHFSLNRSCVRE